MRRWIACLVLFVGCDTPGDLEWLTPADGETVPMGDPIELAVTTEFPAGDAVRFAVDGVEIAVCDPAALEEDCMRHGVWRWTTVFAQPGTHVISASYLDDEGAELEVSRTVTVVRELPLEDLADDLSVIGTGEPVAEEPDDLPALEAAGRGRLDPDRGYHSIYGGIRWRVYKQRVRLKSGIPSGSVSAVNKCMKRFGGSIRKWADHYRISRASVVATALTESNCTNPAGSSDGLSSGPMQVTGSTCSAITGLSRTTCRKRMHNRPDFSFKVGARYTGSSYQRKQHRRDPPKISAAYNAGSLRKSFSNRWHLVSTGNHIDRFVRHYNAYRVWESKQ